jgi:hypothetical protein
LLSLWECEATFVSAMHLLGMRSVRYALAEPGAR